MKSKIKIEGPVQESTEDVKNIRQISTGFYVLIFLFILLLGEYYC